MIFWDEGGLIYFCLGSAHGMLVGEDVWKRCCYFLRGGEGISGTTPAGMGVTTPARLRLGMATVGVWGVEGGKSPHLNNSRNAFLKLSIHRGYRMGLIKELRYPEIIRQFILRIFERGLSKIQFILVPIFGNQLP